MIKQLSTLLLVVCIPAVLFAQNKIETDRPTETQSATLVPKGSFQAELGFRKDQHNKDDYSLQHPNAVFRYGLLNRLELRLEGIAETERLPSENSFNYGLKPVEAGIKANLFHTKDSSFFTSVYGLVGIPKLASDDHQHEETFYRLRLLFHNELTEKIKLNYNVGRDWNSDDLKQNWVYSVSPQFDLFDKWQVFFEAYGFLQKDSEPEHYVDAGIAYFLTKDIEIDINGGKGLSRKASDYFFTTGISFRIR